MTDFSVETNSTHGYRFISPVPDQDSLDAFYAQDFYQDGGQFNNSSHDQVSKDRDFHYGQLSDIEHWIGYPQRKELVRILDVGCGYGQALEFFRDRGYQVSGIDPAPDAVAFCTSQGLDVNCSNAEEALAGAKNTSDLILLRHVVEHVRDPQHLLDLCFQNLSPSGFIYIEVPNDFSLLQTIARETQQLDEWWIGPPRHLSYFNSESLTSLTSAVGFHPVIVTTDFPLEMFLLWGEDYIGQPEVGASVHERRVKFESAFRETGRAHELREIYQALGDLGIGRQIRYLGQKVID